MLLIFKHYRKAEKIRSSDQLKSDFGAYPPSPLAQADINHEVSIVHAAGLGVVIDSFRVCLAILSVKVDGEGARLKAIEAPGGKNPLEGITNRINKSLRNWNHIFRRVALEAVRILLALVMFTGAVWANWSKPNRLGMFYPTGKKRGLILISNRFERLNRDIEAVISHEHLHFLQHVDEDMFNNYPGNLDRLLPEKYQGSPEIVYVLEKVEVEARLHEVVLSYYRINKQLPLTITGFYVMLAKNSQLKNHIGEFLGILNIELDESLQEYSTRDPEIADDIRKIFRVLNDPEKEFRFVTEVLTVMYGNLIRYYGDYEASKTLHANISRPNLYDMLYENHPYNDQRPYDFNISVPS